MIVNLLLFVLNIRVVLQELTLIQMKVLPPNSLQNSKKQPKEREKERKESPRTTKKLNQTRTPSKPINFNS